MSLTSKGCSPLAALRSPSRLLGKLGRASRSKREPSSSIHLHAEGQSEGGVVGGGVSEWRERKVRQMDGWRVSGTGERGE